MGERLKILFAQKRPLFPLTTGGQIRTHNILSYLSKWHDVTYVCNVREDEQDAAKKMAELGMRWEGVPWNEAKRGTWKFYGEVAASLCSRYPYNVWKDTNSALTKRIEEVERQQGADVVVCDFVQMANNVRGVKTRAKVLFEHNVEAEVLQRLATGSGSFARRWLFSIQARRMQKFERDAGKRFARVIAVSPRDKRIFEEEYGWKHVRVIDTAVDVEYFSPQDTPEVQGRLVFTGSMDWLPNEDGMVDFVARSWPLIRQMCPEATLQIVGRRPTEAVKNLSQVAGVEVVGTVPDVRPYLAAASVVVVPLRIGGGTRLKIFEAMAMRKACVGTELGSEGLGVTHGENIVLAEAGEKFASEVVRLLRDERERKRLADNGLQLVREHYTSEKIARQFEAICFEAVEVGRAQKGLVSR